MEESQEILKIRVLLCFHNAEENGCTVTGIAKVLRKEKYTISRILAAMEKEGLVDREDPRSPRLTNAGWELGDYYAERMDYVIRHLTQKGIDPVSARHDALHWALYCSDATMEMLKKECDKNQLKQQVSEKKRIKGDRLFEKLSDGIFEFPFLLCQDGSHGVSLLSAANAGLEDCCLLSKNEKGSTLHLRAKNTVAGPGGRNRRISRQIFTIKYLSHGEYIFAEKRGNVFSVPADALEFSEMGEGEAHMIRGSVQMQLGYGSDGGEISVIFTLFI